MVRAAVAAALGLLVAAVPAGRSGVIERRTGGTVTSPDGRRSVESTGVPQPHMLTGAYLRGPGVRSRLLLEYERSVQVVWPGGGRHVLLVEQQIGPFRLHFFTLGTGRSTQAAAMQGAIERHLARRLPVIQTVALRRFAWGALNSAVPCVRVIEAGLPPSRQEGEYVQREAAFRLDLPRNRVVPIARCVGAFVTD